jgi:GTP-binding protein Era
MQSVIGANVPKFLAVNKIDIARPDKLMPELNKLHDIGFDEIVACSAKRGDNMDKLLALIAGAMPEGPKYFPDDMMTDQPERILIAELIREKALTNLREEVPHGIGVEIMGITTIREGLIEINADIYCDRASHKSIVIGKSGATLKAIGSQARLDIERLMGAKVALHLFVKVRENWRDKASDLRALGYTNE